jgi:hypothetical protein
MRISAIAVVATTFVAVSARADDTKPPQISEVRASLKGGQVQVEARITDETGVLSAICHHRGAGGRVEDSPMVKNDYDDVFRASFPGGPDTEYWIEASDLLGNGPATYGSSAKAFAVGSAAPGPAARRRRIDRYRKIGTEGGQAAVAACGESLTETVFEMPGSSMVTP